jgi:hypothetical protein
MRRVATALDLSQKFEDLQVQVQVQVQAQLARPPATSRPDGLMRRRGRRSMRVWGWAA